MGSLETHSVSQIIVPVQLSTAASDVTAVMIWLLYAGTLWVTHWYCTRTYTLSSSVESVKFKATPSYPAVECSNLSLAQSLCDVVMQSNADGSGLIRRDYGTCDGHKEALAAATV
jgi:hypothetical protein